MAKSVGKKASNIFVWIIMGLLLVALAGFGIGGFSGGASRLGSVGDVEISARDYANALQAEIRARQSESGTPVNLADLRANNLDAAVRQSLFARAALENEARNMGLSVGDEEVANQILETPNFQLVDGNFDRQAYEFYLSQLGLDAGEFEEDVRQDASRSILQFAVVGGITAPAVYAETVLAYQGETRDFSILEVTEGDLPTPVADADDATLQAHFDENAQRFTRSEQRRITYAWVTPSAIMDDMEISEDALRTLYEQRDEIYNQPERRLLERLVFPSTDEAQTAFDAIEAGETDFDQLVEDRGLTLTDVDLGDVQRGDLSEAAAEMIFADTDSEIIGPLESAFGPALFRINAVLDAQTTSFEEAEIDLRAELAVEAARRTILDLREAVDDLLASGATVEEVADETLLELGEIEFSPASEDGIAGYDNFRDAAFAAQEGDFPEVLDLSDGGLFTLRLDAIVPPALPPFDEVRDEVLADWRLGAVRAALAEYANTLVEDLVTGAQLEDLGSLAQEVQIRRQDFIPDTPPTLVAQVFLLDSTGDTVVVPASEAAYIARLDSINAANRAEPDTELLLEIVTAQIAQSLAGDMFESFGQAMQADAGISFNQSVVNQVHASFP